MVELVVEKEVVVEEEALVEEPWKPFESFQLFLLKYSQIELNLNKQEGEEGVVELAVDSANPLAGEAADALELQEEEGEGVQVLNKKNAVQLYIHVATVRELLAVEANKADLRWATEVDLAELQDVGPQDHADIQAGQADQGEVEHEVKAATDLVENSEVKEAELVDAV